MKSWIKALFQSILWFSLILTTEITAMLYHRFIYTYVKQHLKKYYHTCLLLEKYSFDVICRLMVLIIVFHDKKSILRLYRRYEFIAMWPEKRKNVNEKGVEIGWRIEPQSDFYGILISQKKALFYKLLIHKCPVFYCWWHLFHVETMQLFEELSSRPVEVNLTVVQQGDVCDLVIFGKTFLFNYFENNTLTWRSNFQ